MLDNGAGQAENFAVAEHSLLDKVHVYSGFLDTFGPIYRSERDVDLRRQVTRLSLPAYFLDGAHDVPGRLAPMAQWYGGLAAPHKDRVTFAEAGHRSLFEQPARFVALMDRVRAETGG